MSSRRKSSSSSGSSDNEFVVVHHSDSDSDDAAASSSSSSSSDASFDDIFVDAEDGDLMEIADAEMEMEMVELSRSPSRSPPPARGVDEASSAPLSVLPPPAAAVVIDLTEEKAAAAAAAAAGRDKPQENAVDDERLTKESYNYLCTSESPLIMVNGVDDDMYDVLSQVDINTVGQLALLEEDAMYDTLAGALPGLKAVVNRAKRLTKLTDEVCSKPSESVPPSVKVQAPTITTPATSSSSTRPQPTDDSPLRTSSFRSSSYSDISPESSIGVLRNITEVDMAILDSLQIYTIRQFHYQFADVVEIVMPEEQDHYRQMYADASEIMTAIATGRKSLFPPVNPQLFRQEVVEATDHAPPAPAPAAAAPTTTSSSSSNTPAHPTATLAFGGKPIEASFSNNNNNNNNRNLTLTLSQANLGPCECPGCLKSADDVVSRLNRDRAHLYVYHYVPEAVYQQIKEEKALKSAYTLFNEYMYCPKAERPYHGWNRVKQAYVRDAAKWMGRRVDLNNVTDADVFAFLVWRASFSFAAFDCTAGPKAIYFTWCPIPREQRVDAICVDQIVAEDLRDPSIADRFSRVIAIDILKLYNNHAAKLYRAEYSEKEPLVVDTNNWLPTSIDVASSTIHFAEPDKMWANFKSGEAYFRNVPHGCVVVGKGFIPADCILFEDDFPAELKSELVIDS